MAAGNKLVFLAAAMAALMVVVAANASTVITTEIEGDDTTATADQMRGGCHRQLRSQYPDRCEQYLMQSMRRGGGGGGGGRRFGGIEDDDSENQGGMGPGFEQCCNELRMLHPRCQCEAMEMLMDEVMRERQGERMGRQRIMREAMKIPMMCGTMQERCHMSSYM